MGIINSDFAILWLPGPRDGPSSRRRPQLFLFTCTNELTDEWAAVSHDGGATFGHNVEQTDVSTNWRGCSDARPNFGDYNSSELLNDNQFVMTWADGRFPGGFYTPPTCTPAPPCDPRPASTPDSLFTIANGLGTGTTK